MIRNIDDQKLLWTLDGEASKDGRQYYIYSPDYGFYSKSEAETICIFLRKHLANIIFKAKA